MTTRRFFVTAALAALALSPRDTFAQSLAAKSSNAGGVRVSVTPKQTGAGADWEFDVVMSTHVKELDADLTTNAVLIGAGHSYQPKSWQGDPPGGHHRKGVLRFPAPDRDTKSFELQITGIGEKRVFQWTTK